MISLESTPRLFPFCVDFAGGVTGSICMVPLRELRNSTKTGFIGTFVDITEIV